MSNVKVQPPEPFDTKSPSTWPRWKKRFERYRIASSLNERSGVMKVSTLIYAMGPEAEDILASFTSPRMPHTLGEIFTHAQFPDFKNHNTWVGRG